MPTDEISNMRDPAARAAKHSLIGDTAIIRIGKGEHRPPELRDRNSRSVRSERPKRGLPQSRRTETARRSAWRSMPRNGSRKGDDGLAHTRREDAASTGPPRRRSRGGGAAFTPIVSLGVRGGFLVIDERGIAARRRPVCSASTRFSRRC